MEAIANPDAKVISLLISTGQSEPGFQDINMDNYTPLIQVVDESIEIVRLLLITDEANVNAQTIDGETALDIAMTKNMPKISKILRTYII